jgi:hypothetical protein
MGRTFIRQDTQIHNSGAYDDTVVPSLANFETNPTNLESDLNNLRSKLYQLQKNQTGGDWFSSLVVPSALDAGSARGVDGLNSDLHALERKRVLVAAVSLADVTVAASTVASGTLTLTANAANNETVTVGTKTYTFQTALTNVNGNVLIGASASDSLDNLIAAINLGAGSGTLYAAATTANGLASAAAGAGDTMTVTALKSGTFGNTIATTETMTDGSFGAATLTGGSGGDAVILGAGQLPPNLVAAVGAVTTRGTVVAAHPGTFGVASLAEVAGSTAISPKNIVEVVHGATRDPVLSDGRTIYGLLQGESGVTDGATITDTTTTRVQVTFVRINAAGDDLETINGSDLGSTSVNFAFTERKALDDLNEQDFLRGAVVDVPASSTVTRQLAYDNQGTTPVNVTTNSTLDLEGAGLTWTIRDDLEAMLFRITEGSAGGTSRFAVGSDVDFFDVDAADNDFLNGAKFDTGSAGTTISVGVTANQIDSGGALKVLSTSADLSLDAGLELNFTDSYRAGSTWSLTDGIALANSSAEWSAFEAEFGEVSLLNAMVQALSSSDIVKTYANVTAAVNADVDVGGVAGGANLDAQLNNMSVGSFLNDHDVYLNGQMLRPGANSGANNDYYPGTSLANGQLMFEFKLKIGDVICNVSRVSA